MLCTSNLHAALICVQEARSFSHLLSSEMARQPQCSSLGAALPNSCVKTLSRLFTHPQATILFDEMPKAVSALRENAHLLTSLRPHVDVPWMPVSLATVSAPTLTHGMYCVLVYRLWRFEQLLSSTSTLSEENRRHVFQFRGAHIPLMLWIQHKSMFSDEDLSLYVEELYDTPRDKFAPSAATGVFTADNCLPLLSNRMWSMIKSVFPHINTPRRTSAPDAGDLFWEVASKLLPGRCLRRGTASLIVGKWDHMFHVLRWALAVLLLNGYDDAPTTNINLFKQQEVRVLCHAGCSLA